MKRVYVSNENCTSRHAVFASGLVNDEVRPRKHGDYHLWPYGIRETKRIANWDHPCVKSRGAGYDLYITRTARAILDLLDID